MIQKRMLVPNPFRVEWPTARWHLIQRSQQRTHTAFSSSIKMVLLLMCISKARWGRCRHQPRLMASTSTTGPTQAMELIATTQLRLDGTRKVHNTLQEMLVRWMAFQAKLAISTWSLTTLWVVPVTAWWLRDRPCTTPPVNQIWASLVELWCYMPDQTTWVASFWMALIGSSTIFPNTTAATIRPSLAATSSRWELL